MPAHAHARVHSSCIVCIHMHMKLLLQEIHEYFMYVAMYVCLGQSNGVSQELFYVPLVFVFRNRFLYGFMFVYMYVCISINQ